MDARTHWEAIYRAKQPHQLSWFQAEPRTSVDLIRRAVPDVNAAIIDVGGGASTLVDRLLSVGYRRLTILDLAPSALEAARRRLGQGAGDVTWMEADVLTADLPPGHFDLWHDRAVFHFLTAAADRARYVEQVRTALRPGGHVLVATFAADGPTRCSGLPVVRYAAAALAEEFGEGFRLITSAREEHVTPSGVVQAFIYALFRMKSKAVAVQ
jgi:SAM-dependent methyltransferase